MWLGIHGAKQPSARRDPFAPPEHCPHPGTCLRAPLPEPRSFGDYEATRRMLVDRYRRLMAQQCACNGHCQEAKV